MGIYMECVPLHPSILLIYFRFYILSIGIPGILNIHLLHSYINQHNGVLTKLNFEQLTNNNPALGVLIDDVSILVT